MHSSALRLERDMLYGLEDLSGRGIGRMAASRLAAAGDLVSPATGLYLRSDHEPHMLDDLAMIAKRSPDVVFNLFTAARFHAVTETVPGGVWIGLPAGRNPPAMGSQFIPGIEALRWKRNEDFTVGVETVPLRGVDMKFTDLHRTAVDMWRYSQANPSLKRHHVRVHDEALTQCWSEYLSRSEGSSRQAAATCRALALGDGSMQAFLAWCRGFCAAWEAGSSRAAP